MLFYFFNTYANIWSPTQTTTRMPTVAVHLDGEQCKYVFKVEYFCTRV